MTYIVSNTDGSLTLAIEDNTINGTDYSVVLLGKNVIDYGRYFAQNSIRQLENFASASPPLVGTVLVGQLWFDKTTGLLKVYNNEKWRPVTTQHVQVDKIVNYSSVGNLPPDANMQYAAAVFNDVDKKLYVDNGTRIQVAGYGGEVSSRYSTDTVLGRPNNYGTRVRTIYFTDTANVPRAVLALVYVNDTTNGYMNKGTTTTRWGKETVMMVVSDHKTFDIKDDESYTEGEEINYYAEFNDANGIGTTIKKGTNVRKDYTAAVEFANQANEANVAYWLNTGTIGSPNPAGYIPANIVIHEKRIEGYSPFVNGTQTLGNTTNRFNQGFINNITTNLLKVGNDPLNPVTTGYTLPTNRGTNGQVLTTNGAGSTTWSTVTSGGGGGVGTITEVAAGSGLTGGGTSGTATLNVGQGTGISVSADAVAVDTTWFDNRVATLLPPGGSGLAVLDETNTLTASASSISFVGAGVTATSPSAGVVTVTIPGGGSSLTIPGSSGQLLYNNGGALGALSTLTYATGTPNQLNLTGRLVSQSLVVSGYTQLASPVLFAKESTASEGGAFQLEKPTTGSSLSSNLTMDLYQNQLRFFDTGGTQRGLFATITTCAAAVGSEIIHSTNFPGYLGSAFPNGVAPKPRAYGIVNAQTPADIVGGAGFTADRVATNAAKLTITLTPAAASGIPTTDGSGLIILLTAHSGGLVSTGDTLNSGTSAFVYQTAYNTFDVYTGKGRDTWDYAARKVSFLVYYKNDF